MRRYYYTPISAMGKLRHKERESNFPKVTQLVRGGTRYWSRGRLALEITLLIVHNSSLKVGLWGSVWQDRKVFKGGGSNRKILKNIRSSAGRGLERVTESKGCLGDSRQLGVADVCPASLG